MLLGGTAAHQPHKPPLCTMSAQCTASCNLWLAAAGGKAVYPGCVKQSIRDEGTGRVTQHNPTRQNNVECGPHRPPRYLGSACTLQAKSGLHGQFRQHLTKLKISTRYQHQVSASGISTSTKRCQASSAVHSPNETSPNQQTNAFFPVYPGRVKQSSRDVGPGRVILYDHLSKIV